MVMSGNRSTDRRSSEKLIKDRQVFRFDGGGKALAAFLRALDSEQDGAGQINVEDGAFGVDGDVANRREVIDVGITRTQGIGFVVGDTKFFVVHFQFDLMDLEFVHQMFGIPGLYR